MEAIETRNDEGYLRFAGLKMRSMAAGAIVFAALFTMGLATEASAQSSSSIVVRARGTAGSESITLRVNNSNVATWTLTTSLQNYTASTTLTGNVTVAFTNDATGRDVQVDYIVVNGTTRQSENQTSNTGFYANGSCGGGSNSEWMHCNGAIAYGALASAGNSVVVRARGTAGTESVSLRVNNTNVATWTMTTALQNYTASTSLTGAITVAFTNDASGRDVQVDYIVVNGATRQAEAQSYNTGLYANGNVAAAVTANGCTVTAPLGSETSVAAAVATPARVFRRQHHDQWRTCGPISPVLESDHAGERRQVGPGRTDAGRIQLERGGPGLQLRDIEQHSLQAAHVHLGRSGAELDQLTERVRTGCGDRGMDS